MKKILLFSVLFVALLLTGCDSKKDEEIVTPTSTPSPTPVPVVGKRLVCSQKVQTVDVNMIADFESETLTYLGLEYKMDLSEYSSAQIDAIKKQDMCSTVAKTMQSYTYAFTNCKQSVTNKTLLITADFDLDKLTGSDLSDKDSIDTAKSELEKQNYSCTITNK